MKTTASLSETMIAAAAAFRVSGRAKPRVLRRLLRFGADLAYVSAPDESIERPPAARWFYDNARMLEEACADALAPVQAEFARLAADKAYLESIMKQNAEFASYLANKTLSKVYRKVGFTAK